MDTRDRGSGATEDRRARRLQRTFLTAVIACFALPFLTVTCYGDTTVSGVQAATKIDIYPSDEPGERQLMREEPANGFAFVALVAATAGLVLSFGSARLRRTVVWAAGTAAIALQGLFVYALDRSWGEAWPRIGFVGALMLAVGAAWAGARSAPRWIGPTIGAVALAMIPGAVIGVETLTDMPWLHIPAYGGGIVAVALAVGAFPAAVRDPSEARAGRPSALRMLAAAAVGLALLAAAAVGAPFLMEAMPSEEIGEAGAGTSYVFAILVLAIFIGASVLAWVVGRAIVRRGRPTRPVPAAVSAANVAG
jgi:hypothetical protein